MKRIKTMGIAVVMALALTAFAGAGTASANNFKADIEPEKWGGSLTGKNHSMYLGPLSYFSCSKVGFSGETKVKTLRSLTVTPELNECEHQSGAPKSWKMNGCKFRLNSGLGTGLIGTIDIAECTKPMEYFNTMGNCETQIGNQNGLGKVEYENILVGGVPAIKVIAKLTGLTYTRVNGGCAEGSKGTFSDGTYYGEWIVKGTSTGGAPAGVEVESVLSPITLFSAEEGPATISSTGGGVAKTAINFPGNGTIWCNSVSYNGTASIVPTASVTVTPSFSGCSIQNALGEAEIPDKDITAGGCSYQVYAGKRLDIVGASCAANPITIAISGCVFTVGPQTKLVGPTLANNGSSGTSRKVAVTGNPFTDHATYTATGGSCLKPGTMNDGMPKVHGPFSANKASGAAQGLWLE